LILLILLVLFLLVESEVALRHMNYSGKKEGVTNEKNNMDDRTGGVVVSYSVVMVPPFIGCR